MLMKGELKMPVRCISVFVHFNDGNKSDYVTLGKIYQLLHVFKFTSDTRKFLIFFKPGFLYADITFY